MTVPASPMAARTVAAPWLSVLVPVFNVREYLAECIESVLAQAPADAGVEVLLLDDCSTDGSAEVMAALDARWPGRLRLMRHERNAGLSAARNTMIGAARGDYLWFLDSDDKLLPGAIEGLREVVRLHAPDAVLCDFAVWRERPRLKHRLRGEGHRGSFDGPHATLRPGGPELLAGLLATGQLHAWSKITRRGLWPDAVRFPAGRYFEDMATMPLALLGARSYWHAPRPWVAYRQRGGSILATMTLPKALDQSAALLAFSEALRGRPEAADAALRFALAHQSARNLTGAMRVVARAAGQPGADAAALDAAADRIRADFAAVSPLPADALARAYLQRGWWLRRLKFLRAHALRQR